MIYAVHILNQKFVKVGYTASDDVTRRVAELQTGNPFEIRVLRIFPGNMAREQELHWLLKEAFLRLNMPVPANEWYPGLHPLFRGFLQAADESLSASVAYLNQRIDNHKEKPKSIKDGRSPYWEVKKRFGSASASTTAEDMAQRRKQAVT